MEYYYIVIAHYDKYHREHIDETGKPNKYGPVKKFARECDAWAWVQKNSYKGMSISYSVKAIVEE